MTEQNIDDELLSAYLDGELDAAQSSRVAAALESDPGARVRLERMRSADQKLRREVAVRGPRPVDPLAEYILRVESDGGRAGSRRVAAPVWALAAGVAGLAMGFLLARGGAAGAGAIPAYARGELQKILENRPSGDAAHASSKTQVLLTMRTADGRSCRLFSSQDVANAGEGLACRDEGGWRVVVWDGSPQASGFRTAGASSVLDAAMDRWDAAVLDAVAERDLLTRRWRPATE